MDSLLINPLTKRRLQSFLAHPSHALLLTGEQGSNLSDIATALRSQLVPNLPDADALVMLEPNEKGTLSIDTVRGLARRLKMRNSSAVSVSVCVVIKQAEAMPTEAQNALLKLLEEPPLGVLFVLLAYEPSKILTTIRSRCVPIEVLPVSLDDAQRFYGDTSTDFNKKYHLSGGNTGLLHELVHDADHQLVHSITLAKEVLAHTPYDRLKLIDTTLKQKELISPFIDALLRICRAAVRSGKATDRWVTNCNACLMALRKLEANVQSKLVLDELFLRLR